eukprot:3207624-Pyramimonas_sp.AAC.1
MGWHFVSAFGQREGGHTAATGTARGWTRTRFTRWGSGSANKGLCGAGSTTQSRSRWTRRRMSNSILTSA